MYVILVNDDNTLSAPKKERIVQSSKLFDKFWFLAAPYYKGYDMSVCTVLLEYLTPVSREYKTEMLKLADTRYEEYLKYVLPIDTEFTKEAGTLEVKLTFIYVDIDADGNPIQRVRKTAPAIKVEIVPIEAWSNIVPDSALSAVDQRIIKVDAQIKALQDMNEQIMSEKADNLKYDESSKQLQLMADGKEIGDSVTIHSDCEIEDGVPIVNFGNIGNNDPDIDTDDKDSISNVVEF